jgi:predicted signal transduction protein with EAL and GGDEF domain
MTAEGVEDADILKALKSMGRLKAQGYFYGYPEDAEAVRERLAASGKLTGASRDAAPSKEAGDEDPQARHRIARQ